MNNGESSGWFKVGNTNQGEIVGSKFRIAQLIFRVPHLHHTRPNRCQPQNVDQSGQTFCTTALLEGHLGDPGILGAILMAGMKAAQIGQQIAATPDVKTGNQYCMSVLKLHNDNSK